MKTGYTKIITYIAVYTALVCVCTMFLKVNFAYGYVNLGDVVIIIGCYLLSFYCIPAAGIGSLLADILTGYAEYALPTVVIKSIMALVVVLVMGKKKNFHRVLISAALSEIIMILGYSLYRLFVYGFAVAVGQIGFEAIQAGTAVIISPVAIYFLSKSSFVKRFLKIEFD